MPYSKVVADTSNTHTHTAIQHGYDDMRQTMTNIYKRILKKKEFSVSRFGCCVLVVLKLQFNNTFISFEMNRNSCPIFI